VRLLGEQWVCYRVGGQVVAWADRCPHRLIPLSAGHMEGDQLRCAYHGWCFSADGLCREIPALGPDAVIPQRARLTPPAALCEQHGLVWMALEDPVAPLPDFRIELAGLELAELPVLDARAGAGQLADNFLDMAHFPFVHRVTFGADEAREVAAYHVERQGWSFTASYTHAFSNREDPGVAAGIRPEVQQRRMTYFYQAPFALLLRLDYLDAGGINVIGFFIQPESEDRCRIYSMLWRNDLDGDADRSAAAVAFELSVVEEDLALQENYLDLALPLDLTVELHTRADRSTLEMRRILADLVAATR